MTVVADRPLVDPWAYAPVEETQQELMRADLLVENLIAFPERDNELHHQR